MPQSTSRTPPPPRETDPEGPEFLEGAGELVAVQSHRPTPERSTPRFDDALCLTVSELLDLTQLAGARLITDPLVAAESRVRTTSVQEVPVQDFVRPGELVMTTGIGLADQDKFTSFVETVARARAAALAVAIGPHVSDVPDAVVGLAERLRLPLLLLPWELRFSEITELVLRHVLDRQGDLLRRSERIQELFTATVLKGGDLAVLCASIERLLGHVVRIEDLWGEAYEAARDADDDASDERWRTAAALPIIAANQRVGTLFVAARAVGLSELELRICRHAATAGALIILMQKVAAEGEARGRGELLTQLIHGQVEPRTAALRLKNLGLHPDGPFGVIVLAFERAGQPRDGPIVDMCRWAVVRSLATLGTPTLHSWQDEEVAVLVEGGDIDLLSYGERLVRELERLLGKLGIRVRGGIGRGRVAIEEIPATFEQARVACRVARSYPPSRAVVAYGDLGVYGALYHACKPGTEALPLESLVSRYLQPVLDYEERTHLPLVDTMVALFATNGNVSATARRLRINRQSLVYRLERLRSLTGLSPTDAYGRFALELALRVWSVSDGYWLDLPEGPEDDERNGV